MTRAAVVAGAVVVVAAVVVVVVVFAAAADVFVADADEGFFVVVVVLGTDAYYDGSADVEFVDVGVVGTAGACGNVDDNDWMSKLVGHGRAFRDRTYWRALG